MDLETGTQGAYPVFDAGKSGKGNRGGPASACVPKRTDPTDKLKTVHVGHADVADKHIGRVALGRV